MTLSHRHRAGFTAVELLVLLMILAVGSVSILPGINVGRQQPNQSSALSRLSLIASQEDLFRSSDADGDGVDDYGSLAELVTAGLVPAALGDGQEQGYSFSVTTNAGPDFGAHANPISCDIGVLRFFVDSSGVVRYNETQPAGPSDPPLPPGGELQTPITPEQDHCAVELAAAARHTAQLALAQADGVTLAQAIDLAGTPGVVDSVSTRLDANADEQITLVEYTSEDWLAVAQAVAADLGDAGPSVGADADLALLLESHQAWLAASLDLDLDPPQPGIALLDLYGRQDQVVAYLASLLPAVPALGLPGLGALAVALAAAAGLARRPKT